MNEKSRLENIWRLHEKSCRGCQSSSTYVNHHHQHTQQQQHPVLVASATTTTTTTPSGNSGGALIKIRREELDEIIKQSQLDASLKKQQQQQQQFKLNNSLVSSIQTPISATPDGFFGRSNGPESNLNNQLMLLHGAMQAAAVNSALMTPNSANAAQSIETLLLSQLEAQQQTESGKVVALGSPGGAVGGMMLQRPNNLNLKAGGGGGGGGGVATGGVTTATSAAPASASFVFMQVKKFLIKPHNTVLLCLD